MRRTARIGTRKLAALGAATAALLLALAVVVPVAFAAALFVDDFEDGNLDGWTRSGGSWSVVVDGSHVASQSSTSARATALTGQTGWSDYSMQARVKVLAFNGSDRFAALAARAQGTTSAYLLSLRSSNRVLLERLVGGASTTVASAPLAVSTGTWYTLRLEVQGGTLRAIVDGALLATASDSQFSAGRVGLVTLNARAEFDDVQVDTSFAPPPSPTPTPSVSPTGSPPPVPGGSPIGFAAVNALGQNGTTGGDGGPVVTVTTAAQFVDFATRTGPYVIRVDGMIALSAMQNVTSDKTIIGVGSGSGFTGFGLTIGLPVSDAITSPPPDAVRNVIIRNLVIRNSGDDAINAQMFSHHVWIDHNDLCCGFDGLVDIKRGSSYITVSWNHTHDHTKNMLLGHDDGNAAQDVGWLKVTYHHNWFDQTPQRNPRVRFGEPVHVFNNYYLHNTDVGVACQANAGCMVEGNYFDNVEEPMTIHYTGPTGRMVERNNVFVNGSGNPVVGGTVQEPSLYYSYALDNAADVRSIVMAGAGVGRI